MKNLKLLYVIPACLLIIFIIQACKKGYLDVAPQGALSEQVLANKTGVEGLLIGTYSRLGGSANWGSAPSNWVFGSVVADEAYKGSTPSDQPDINPLESWAYNANNGYLNEKWVNNYNGIGRANETIRMIEKATDLTADEVKRITAEARFLRGWFHFELKKVFSNIPYVDEKITVANNNTNVSNVDYRAQAGVRHVLQTFSDQGHCAVPQAQLLAAGASGQLGTIVPPLLVVIVQGQHVVQGGDGRLLARLLVADAGRQPLLLHARQDELLLASCSGRTS